MKVKDNELTWPEVYLRMFAPIMIVVLITIGADAWVEYEERGVSPFFIKDLITMVIIGFSYALFSLEKLTKTEVINISVYTIVVGIMLLLPFRLQLADFYFEVYFLKVEIILIILTYAIGILVHPKHILYLLILNLIFITACIVAMQDAYPISKFVFYVMLMTATSLLGYKLNRIFLDLNIQVAEANELIQSQNEDLKRANEAKDQLFEILGHDLKAPFFHLSALVSLLNNTDDEEKKQEYIDLMKDAICRGDKLVGSLLDWVDVQSTYLKFTLEKDSIERIIDTAIDVKKADATLKDLRIIKSVPSDFKIAMDSRMMDTIFRNLISNAIKFSYRGGNICVRAINKENEAFLSVTDEGVGMDEEVIQQLFTYGKIPTQKGTENETGSGFGLNICKKMVENQKGTMEIQSKPNQGTTVLMRFSLMS